jgi:HEPN domain-containing protein
MTPQREEALRLLRLAKRDRETFDLLLPLPKANLAALGFHAQQAAEKALKAVAVSIELEVPRTHDLAALGQIIIDSGTSLPVTVDQLRELNPFAVEYRYDDELIPAISRQSLASTLSIVMAWAEQRLPA